MTMTPGVVEVRMNRLEIRFPDGKFVKVSPGRDWSSRVKISGYRQRFQDPKIFKKWRYHE